MFRRITRLFAVPFVVLMTLSGALSTDVTAEDDGFHLVSSAAFCEPGFSGPFVGCTQWEGITVSLVSDDGAFSDSCETSGSTDGRVAFCTVVVPFGSTIVASIEPSVIPAGYSLQGATTQTFEIPDGPPDGVYNGPSFVLLPDDGDSAGHGDTPPGRFALPANTAFCQPGYLGPFQGCAPWEGVMVTFATPNGAFEETCITTAMGGNTASCSVNVPVITTIIASIDPASIPDSYVLEGDATQQFEISDGPPDGEFAGPIFVLLPEDDEVIYPSPVVDAPKVPLAANTAYCEPGYLGPFVGCTPWNGVVVTYTSADGTFNESCTASGAEVARAASCTVNVPVLATITASIDPATIPDGYVLEGDASETLDIPVGPLEGQLNNPSFVLLPANAIEEGDSDDIGLVTQLPVTGSGDALEPDALPPVIVMLIAAIIIGAAGVVTSRRMQ